MAVIFFATLYRSEPSSCGAFPLCRFQPIQPDKLLELTTEYTNEEIYVSLKEMNPLKAPGLDGFQTIFFQKSWEYEYLQLKRDWCKWQKRYWY